ncbi:butyrophilin-like protein 2 [Osmerus eperlanus]|uniref:butyrophilin-like protein 2 n=1 Tax=Osmerus eperlanus TaxID=29151 RepID=UPI002E137449
MLLGVAFLVVIRFIYAKAGDSHPATVVGGDVTLPCSLGPGHSAMDMTIEWRKSEQDKGPYVHVRRGNKDETDEQIPSYNGRTALYGTDELRKGNISLKLSRVKLSDAGNYTCFFNRSKVTTTRLTVVTASPVISVLGASDGKVRLQCEATTWYKDANVEWWDGEGDELTPEKEPEIVSKDNKHYVKSYLTVPENKTDETFTCRVYQANKTAQARSEKLKSDTFSGGYIASITIAVIGGPFGFFVVGWLVCRHCQQARNSVANTSTALNRIPLTSLDQ